MPSGLRKTVKSIHCGQIVLALEVGKEVLPLILVLSVATHMRASILVFWILISASTTSSIPLSASNTSRNTQPRDLLSEFEHPTPFNGHHYPPPPDTQEQEANDAFHSALSKEIKQHATVLKGGSKTSIDLTTEATRAHSIIGTPGMSPEVTTTISEVATPTSSATASTPTSSTDGDPSNALQNESYEPNPDSTKWKIAGLALISISVIVILVLSIIFFDSWTRFVRDVILGKGRGGGWRGRNEPDLVPDWEKRSWEVKLSTSEDHGLGGGDHRYPSLPSLTAFERVKKDGGKEEQKVVGFAQ